jgi:hypothetical protein
MWRQHKKSQYGVRCSDNCNCVFDLPYLTATVLETKVKAKRKNEKSKWIRNKDPTGFVDNFAPKFLPMLQAEFPHEIPQQLLHRLLGMWEKHTRQRNFGLRCSDTCDCMEGWSQVFCEGRDQKQSSTETSTSHTTNEKMPDPGEQSMPATVLSGLASLDSREKEDSIGRKASPRVPKKRKAQAISSLISGLIPPSQTAHDESGTDGSGMHRPNNSNRVPKKKKKAAATSSEPELHTTGNGSLLRNIDESKTDGSGMNRANLSNRVPKKKKNAAATSSEPALHTTGSGLLRGLLKQEVPPSQAPIEESKTDGDGSGMHLTNLSNRVPKKKKNAAATSSEHDLHTTGSGLLRSLLKPEALPSQTAIDESRSDGNGSGMHHANRSNRVPKKKKNAAATSSEPKLHTTGSGLLQSLLQQEASTSKQLRSLNPPPSTQGRIDSSMESTTPADTWVTVDTKRAIRVEDLPKPILKNTDRGGGNAGKRKVQFGVSPINEFQFYEIGSKTTEFQIKPSEEVNKGTRALSTGSSKDQSSLHYHNDITLQVSDSPTSLSDAIQNKSFQDVLSYFESMKDSGAQSSERLKEVLRIVKDSLVSIDAELALKPRDEALRRQRRDFEFKNSFLKICINAAYALQIARSLKNWVRFEIVVTMLDEIELSDHAMLDGGENTLSAEVTATYVSRIHRCFCVVLLDTDVYRRPLIHSADLFICFKLFLSGSQLQRAFDESSIETGIVPA